MDAIKTTKSTTRRKSGICIARPASARIKKRGILDRLRARMYLAKGYRARTTKNRKG